MSIQFRWCCYLVLTVFSTNVSSALAQTGEFVNFETPHVHPLSLTPDGTRLLAVNTADNRLEIFLVNNQGLSHPSSVPVGLEPVSVRARTSNEAWVVNQLSDTVSVVDLDSMSVVATIRTGDEPADVVFAGAPERAFISVSQHNQIEVFDPNNLEATPIIVPIAGEDPRALATDGTHVYAAIFEAGNMTTIIAEDVVDSSLNPYPGNQNPPPNVGNNFEPPMTPGLPDAPAGGIIVRKDATNRWMDDNDHDWSAAVSWDLHGHGLAVIDTDDLSVSYATGLLTTNMACTARSDGTVAVVGTNATNEIRFEPNLKGTFIRVEGATVSQGSSQPEILRDLNPHLDYSVHNIPWEERIQSIGDPRGVAYSPDGETVFVTGMGSMNLGVFDSTLSRLGLVEVGAGPTGVVVDADGERVYTLNRFEGSVSVVDASVLAEVARVSYFDPTPQFIRDGRSFLFDTHITSGLGQVSCASCHVDARIDHLAWDLGDPSGEMKRFNQECNLSIPFLGDCEDWHPVKGPMTTQTLVGLNGSEPFHWRGDRENFQEFNHAFVSLLGGDTDGLPSEMAALEAYLGSIVFPPNPNRNLDGSMPSSFEGGDPYAGEDDFISGGLDIVECVTCHEVPTGGGSSVISANLLPESQSMKIPQLRNMYQKVGMDSMSQSGNKGFGFLHDGSLDTLITFLELDVFNFLPDEFGDQQRRDVAAFMMCWDTETSAAVGAQAQIGGAGGDDFARRDLLVVRAAAGEGDLTVRMIIDGKLRGGLRLANGIFQTDIAKQTVTLAELDALATTTNALVYTLVPSGSGTRIALDRDGDGYFDTDELLVCADPADPTSTPGNGDGCIGADLNGDGHVDAQDLGILLANWGPCSTSRCIGDINFDGVIDSADLGLLLAAWGT